MTTWLAGAAVLVLFTGAALLADTMTRRKWLPPLVLGLLLFFVFVELARYDHGYADAFFWIGWVGAPLVAIFGGASWGTRRFYGWPDLGAHPSRAAFVAAMIIAGVMVGVRLQQSDVDASMKTAEALAKDVVAWRDAHEGRVPPSLDTVASPTPTTHLGLVAPPPYTLGVTRSGTPLIAFPLGGTAWMTLDLERGEWSRRSRAPRPVPGS